MFGARNTACAQTTASADKKMLSICYDVTNSEPRASGKTKYLFTPKRTNPRCVHCTHGQNGIKSLRKVEGPPSLPPPTSLTLHGTCMNGIWHVNHNISKRERKRPAHSCVPSSVYQRLTTGRNMLRTWTGTRPSPSPFVPPTKPI